MKPSLKAAAMAALLTGAVLTAAPALAGNKRHVAKRVRARCKLSADTPIRVTTMTLTEGARVDVSVRKSRHADLVPTLRVLRPDGTEFRPLDMVGVRSAKGLALSTFSVPAGESGVWSFVVGSEAGAGTARLSVRAREPRTAVFGPRLVAAGRTESLQLAALPGRDLVWRVSAPGVSGSGVTVELIDPEGRVVASQPRGRLSVRTGGVHRLRITAGTEQSARVTASLRVRRGTRAKTAADIAIPDDFRFETTRSVPVSVVLRDADGQPLPGVVVSLQTLDREVLHRGRTDSAGHFDHDLTLSTELASLRIVLSTIGLAADHVVPVTSRIELHVD